jgi:hypothetical protein
MERAAHATLKKELRKQVRGRLKTLTVEEQQAQGLTVDEVIVTIRKDNPAKSNRLRGVQAK